MGLFDKKEEIVEEKVELTEFDKLETYIKKKNLKEIKDFLIKQIKENYIEGITDYKKCIEYIDICSNNEVEISSFQYPITILKQIYEIYMNFENKNITYNLLNIVLKSEERSLYLDYMFKSRAYFTDSETWAARVYEVFNEKIDRNEALNEDKMRLGIYTNISDKTIEELNKKLECIKIHSNSISADIEKNEKHMESINSEIREKSKKLIDNIDNTFESSISELQNFTNEALDSIKRILNANPSSSKEILKEIEKQFNVIEAFDDKVSIKERYDKLISLKNNTIIYHPKFNEVLKYVLIGNTVCLSGPNKCGKTTLVKQLAELLNLSFNNLGNIYDEVTQINGYYDFNTNYNKPVFQKCFENGGIVLMKNINNAPYQAVSTLNNIISNFKYNPYIFGDKKLTTPNKNFRLIMTNNNGLKIDEQEIDNLVTINLDYDTSLEKSLTKDELLVDFLHNLRNLGLNITTSTFIDIINHLETGLFSPEELIINYIISNNSIDLLKRKSEEISQDNKYNNTLKKILKG